MAYTLKGKLDSIAAGLSGINSVASAVVVANSTLTSNISDLSTAIGTQSAAQAAIESSASVVESAASTIEGVDLAVDSVGTQVSTADSKVVVLSTANSVVGSKVVSAHVVTDSKITDLSTAVSTALGMDGDAAVANVLITKTFYNSTYTSKLTGTMPNNSVPAATSQAISATGTTTIGIIPPVGYYDGVDDLVQYTEENLVTSKIASGATILGVSGAANIVDTTEALSAAGAGQVSSGYFCWVNGARIEGTLE